MAVGTDGVAVAGIGAKVNEALFPLLGDKHSVEPGQALGVHLTRELAGDIHLSLRSQFQRHQVAGPVADAMGDVVAGNVQNLAIVGNPPDHDMGVGVAGIVVIDRDPIELGTKVGLQLPHQVAGEAAQIAHLDGILGRHDEAELMAVLTAAGDEGAAVGLVLPS